MNKIGENLESKQKIDNWGGSIVCHGILMVDWGDMTCWNEIFFSEFLKLILKHCHTYSIIKSKQKELCTVQCCLNGF